MSKINDTLLENKPHTQAKHEILRRYLGAWFPILGKYNGRILYIDGFCGPGRCKGGEDGSPLIALKEAMKHNSRFPNREVTFLFIDSDKRRIEHLESELALLPLPVNFSVFPIHDQFDNTLKGLLDDLAKQGANLAPTFAFIDPFGFKGVPFDLVARLLKNPKTEVFINMMVDSINRFVEHPTPVIQQEIINLFGTSKVIDIIQTGGDRITNLRLLYQSRLCMHAKYVRYFEMRDKNNRVIYYLFFATNHPLGHARMKESFWQVDPSSGFSFSDRTDPKQMILFNTEPSYDLASDLHIMFKGKKLKVDEIRQYVENETAYIAKHMRDALRRLEINGKLRANPLKDDGEKRKLHSFPDNAIVEFLTP